MAADGSQTSERSGYALSPADGSPLFYRVSGIGNPQTLVLCDGIGCDGFVWKYLRRDLSAKFRVVHWHYRGHGRSPKPRDPDRITTADFADDLVAVLDDTDAGTATLVGHSMGVQVALETYRRHRGRVEALVLVCGAPGHLLKTFRGTGSFEALLPGVRKAIDRAPRLFNGLARAILPTRLAWNIATKLEIDADLINPLDFMPYLRGLSHIEVAYFLRVLEHASQHTAADVLPSIDVPALVIGGERDNFTPPKLSREMADAIPDAELFMIEDGTHTAPIERPRLVVDAIEAFLLRRVTSAS